MKTTISVISIFILSLTFSNLHAQATIIRTSNSRIVVNNKTNTVRVTKLPKEHKVIVHKRVKYYYFNGHYYSLKNDVCVKVAAPKGLMVTALPAKAKRVTIRKKVYYCHNGVYYKKIRNKQYKVVRV